MAAPAHDERETIAACLHHIERARKQAEPAVRTHCVVVADACRDDTVAIARRTLPGRIEAFESHDRCVGAARRRGVELGLSMCTVALDRIWIASTDADTLVRADWILRQLHHADVEGSAAVAGLVVLDPAADAELRAMFVAAYRIPEQPPHPHVHGANLGLRASAYRAAGGWADRVAHEDHDLWNRLRATWPTSSPIDLVVETSARRVARAPEGFRGVPRRPDYRDNRSGAGVTPSLRELVHEVGPLPLPGKGQTALRWRMLQQAARQHDLGIARLLEAHVDAAAILAEAGQAAATDTTYAVWASATPGVGLRWRHGAVSGSMHFCSASGVVDRALVLARDDDGGELLIDVEVRPDAARCRFDHGSWHTGALVSTATATATLDGLPGRVVGEQPGWYLQRPGFWHGACGPAACWSGGALGLLDTARERSPSGPHAEAALGALAVEEFAMAAVLREAGEAIDRSPADARHARRIALMTREFVERSCARLTDVFERTFGPRPFVQHAETWQRFVDVHLYLRQCHGPRDLETLGRLDGSRGGA